MKARIIRPDFYEGDKIVKLKATVTSGEVTKTKVFDFLVRKAFRTDEQSLAEDEKYIRSQIPLKVRENLPVMAMNVLPAGSTVVWSTDESEFIDNKGMVLRPDFGLPNESVTITATLTKGSQTKEVVITVDVLSLTEEDEISSAAKKITWNLIRNKNIDKSRITGDLTFPEDVDGIPVTWGSSNANYIAIDGKVTRPEYTDSDVQVTVTATLVKGDKRTVVTLTGLKVLKKSASAQQRVEEYVKTPDKWMHWVTANGTNENTGLDSIKESFILPAEQDDMMLTWSVVNSSGEPTTVSYINIEYQDDASVMSGVSTFSGNRRYAVTIVRPATEKIQVFMKATAEISETEIEDVQVPGGEASQVHQLTIIGEKVAYNLVDAIDETEGRATWSAPLHKKKQELKNKEKAASVASLEEVQK